MHDLGQFFTPEWAAEELVRHYFGDLTLCDRVLEPSCGPGAFLAAVPNHVPALGVEIDPTLAERARQATGRPVLVGDFRTIDLPLRPTVVLGNPPFKQALVQDFLERAFTLLPDQGRVGFVLPCYVFQTASTIERMAARWGIRQDMLPRNLFQRLSMPLCFAVLTKGRAGDLVGFTLYHELAAVTRLKARYRALLAQGERSVWAAVTRAAFDALGGQATLPELYAEIAGARPTGNRFWREKVRQVVQQLAVRVGPATWRLVEQQERAA
ncbi:MAG TPA: class I SAM-dependent methyltransferase [Arenimonas sp.]